MKFTVKDSVNASLASIAGLFLLNACGMNANENAKLVSAEQSREVSGIHAAALYGLLEEAGIAADTIDGRVIIGATTLSAETVHCSIASTANQDKRCEIQKSGEAYDVSKASVAASAIESLDSLGAQVDRRLIGAINYEIKNLSCTSPVVLKPEISCSYELSHGRSDLALELSGLDASTFFDSMEASGIQPATINGQVIYGSTTLNADAIHCTSSFDANFTKHCEITDGPSGSELKLNDAAMARKMVEVMERIGAKVNPQLVGANNYQVLEVSCTKPVVPNPEVSCHLKLVK